MEELIKQIIEQLASVGRVNLMFENTTEKAAKGHLILQAVADHKLAQGIKTSVPMPSFTAVSYVEWEDGKCIELATRKSVEDTLRKNPQSRQRGPLIAVPEGPPGQPNLNPIREAPQKGLDD